MTILLRQTASLASGVRVTNDARRAASLFGVQLNERMFWTHPKFSGGDIEEVTPDPISNSEVKLLGADGTARET